MSLRNPVGPQPPSVYWRRRLLVIAGLVAIVVVVILIIVRPGASSPEADETPTPGSTSTPSVPPEDVDEDALCDPSVVTLEPITDAASYGPDNQPLLSMSITNSGAVACTLDVGTAAQQYVITSGTERIWSSADCQEAPAESPMVFQAGETKTTTPFPWARIRSAPDSCGADRPPVVAGGASYHLTVLLGELESADTKQFVLQ